MTQDRRISDKAFARELDHVPAAGDRARLVALDYTSKMTAAKERRLRREKNLKAVQLSKDAPETKAAERKWEIKRRERTQIQAEIQRNETPTPEPRSDRFILHGRTVNPQGLGRSGLTVSAIDEQDKVVTSECTDERGYFKLEISSKADQQKGRNVRLLVSNQQQAILYRGKEKHSVIPNRITYREISVGENGKEPCAPPPEPKPEPKPKMVEVPDLMGHKEKEAVKNPTRKES